MLLLLLLLLVGMLLLLLTGWLLRGLLVLAVQACRKEGWGMRTGL